MKPEARVLAVDDGPHLRSDARTLLVGVVAKGAQYVEGVLTSHAGVDGSDATGAIERMVVRSRFRPLVRALLLNGIFVGGFNLVDVDVLRERLRLPVLALVRSAPRPRRVRKALEAAFPDAPARWAAVQRLMPERLPGLRLWGTVRGMPMPEAARLCARLTVRGHWPEPLRLAHVIASGLARGESRGRP